MDLLEKIEKIDNRINILKTKKNEIHRKIMKFSDISLLLFIISFIPFLFWYFKSDFVFLSFQSFLSIFLIIGYGNLIDYVVSKIPKIIRLKKIRKEMRDKEEIYLEKKKDLINNLEKMDIQQIEKIKDKKLIDEIIDHYELKNNLNAPHQELKKIYNKAKELSCSDSTSKKQFLRFLEREIESTKNKTRKERIDKHINNHEVIIENS